MVAPLTELGNHRLNSLRDTCAWEPQLEAQRDGAVRQQRTMAGLYAIQDIQVAISELMLGLFQMTTVCTGRGGGRRGVRLVE